jgi:hypothetical protein
LDLSFPDSCPASSRRLSPSNFPLPGQSPSYAASSRNVEEGRSAKCSSKNPTKMCLRRRPGKAQCVRRSPTTPGRAQAERSQKASSSSIQRFKATRTRSSQVSSFSRRSTRVSKLPATCAQRNRLRQALTDTLFCSHRPRRSIRPSNSRSRLHRGRSFNLP